MGERRAAGGGREGVSNCLSFFHSSQQLAFDTCSIPVRYLFDTRSIPVRVLLIFIKLNRDARLGMRTVCLSLCTATVTAVRFRTKLNMSIKMMGTP